MHKTTAEPVADVTAPPAPLARPLQEVNERCIALLVQAAQVAHPDEFPLVARLRNLLGSVTPEVCARAARKGFPLVDLEFANEAWWRSVRLPSARTAFPRRGGFPREGGVDLTRATLTLAWHAVRADNQVTCLFGMSSPVSKLIADLSIAEMDRLARSRYRSLRPRWEDRPAVWRQLIVSSQTPDIRRARESSLRGLRLIAGELL